MKKLASLLLPLLLAGCAFVQAFGITPASAPLLVAVAAELRAGANVIRADARGDTLGVRVWCFRIRQAREGFNGTAGLQLAPEPKAALARSRDLTENVCTNAGVPAVGPMTAPIPVEPAPLVEVAPSS